MDSESDCEDLMKEMFDSLFNSAIDQYGGLIPLKRYFHESEDGIYSSLEVYPSSYIHRFYLHVPEACSKFDSWNKEFSGVLTIFNERILN